jgi:elongation factor P--(R)-beta-lysine ligase
VSPKRSVRKARRSKPATPAPEVLAPSDLLLRARSASVRVAGRVVDVRGSTVVLADALGVVTVRFAAEAPSGVGDLVVVHGRWRGGILDSARVVECLHGEGPASGTEFGRLAGANVGRNLAARALALRVVRDYFDERGFIEIETPVRVPSPGLDAYVDAVRSEDRWLITSPELAMKRLIVGGMPRIYQLSRVNRAGEHGAWHEGEFTMLEWYRAFSGMDAVIADTEGLVAAVVRALAGRTKVRAPSGSGTVDVTPPFARTTVREAFRRSAGVRDAVALAAEDPNRYFQTFVDAVEPALSRSKRPVVLTEFPTSQGALARPCPHDPSVSERFEVYVAGVELSNGFGELTDPVEQRRRFESEKERRQRSGAPDQPIDERFLEALREGMPPSGGNALGFDRLVALALGMKGVADVMAFPQERL